MAFSNGNYNSFNNNNNGNQQSDEKHSWRIGKDIKSGDAKFSVGLYESQYKTPFCSIQILRSIGKDPTTGVSTYEQRPPQEIPSVLVTHEMLEALVDRFTDKTRPSKDRDFFPNWIDPTNINETFDCGFGSKITINGSPTDVKIKVEKEGKGDRTGTLTAVQMSGGANFASWRMFLQKLYYILSYMCTAGIDADKFSTAMASTTGMTMAPTESVVADDIPII